MSKAPEIQARVSAVAKELANGKKRGEILAKFGKKWKVSSTSIDRLIAQAKSGATQLTNKANAAAEKAIVSDTVEAARNGLKTKHDRIMILQGQCDRIMTELNAGKYKKTSYDSRGKAREREYILEPEQTAMMRRNLRDLQAEISKIEGDYAPEKHKHEGELSFFEMYKKASTRK